MIFQLLGEIPTIHEMERFGTRTNRVIINSQLQWTIGEREREREREAPSEINLLPAFLI
jgi:hypothetical protein